MDFVTFEEFTKIKSESQLAIIMLRINNQISLTEDKEVYLNVTRLNCYCLGMLQNLNIQHFR